MKPFVIVMSSALLLSGSLAQAKGRRPGDEPFDYSRVRRGSPANPTSAYQPPQFNDAYAPPEEKADTDQNASRASKKDAKASKKESQPYEETWTLEGGSAQTTVPPESQTAPAATTPAPPAGGIYEPPLPDEPQPDPLAPAKKK